jgi:crossover junction endodeoxyribonuclease RusA
VIVLPWPPKELNPNSRVHHQVLAKHKKQYKEVCWALVKESKVLPPDTPKIHLGILFVPPNRQRRDLDNCLAAMKAGIDGLASAWGIDDNRFMYTIDMAQQVGGMVKIQIINS